MIDVKELLKLAKAATPGPWYPGHLSDDTHSCNCASIVDEGYAGGIATIHVDNGIRSIADGGNDAPPLEEAKANQRFIAAANPATIIQLLKAYKSYKTCAEYLLESKTGDKTGYQGEYLNMAYDNAMKGQKNEHE